MNPLRRAIYRLRRPSEILSPLRKKYLLVPHTVMGLIIGLSAFFDETARESSIVFNLIYSWISVTFWAVMFLASGLIGLYGVMTGSWKAYALTNILTFGLSLSFIAALFVAKIVEGVYISPIVIALWVFVFSTSVVLTTITNNVIRTKE